MESSLIVLLLQRSTSWFADEFKKIELLTAKDIENALNYLLLLLDRS